MIDLKETIAKAIHDSYEHDPELYGSWEEEVAATKTIDSVHPSYTDPYVGRVRDDAASAIAAMREALLSEVVVSEVRGYIQHCWDKGFPPNEEEVMNTALAAIGAVTED